MWQVNGARVWLTELKGGGGTANTLHCQGKKVVPLASILSTHFFSNQRTQTRVHKMRWKEHNTSDCTLGFKFWVRNTGVQRQPRQRGSGTEQPECVKEHGRLSREMWMEKDGGWEWVRMTLGIWDVTTRDGGAACDVATAITVVFDFPRSVAALFSLSIYRQTWMPKDRQRQAVKLKKTFHSKRMRI